MSLIADARTIFHLCFAPRDGEHATWLDRFYRHQAEDYDRFRERLLHGRKRMYRALGIPDGGVLVDFGGGTGSQLEHVPNLKALKKVYLVDLCEPLLERARERVRRRRWKNVEVIRADASRFAPPRSKVDAVTFSYSLSMMPGHPKILKNAEGLLKQGGKLGVVDFYVSSDRPIPGRARHAWLTRKLWPVWFARDRVHLSPEILDRLDARFPCRLLEESAGPLPYLPWVRVPYYVFIGTKTKAHVRP